MVSLTNQARLLAAQAANKKILEAKALERKREIEAERQKDLGRTTKRLQIALQNARNPVEASKIQASIKQTLSSKTEVARRKRVNETARRKTEKATGRAFGASAGRIGILTGFEARKDSKGRIQGISRKESATRKNTKKLLLREIQHQERLRTQETDLERFLKNERAISRGEVSSAQLRKQIAQRKARGLSQTPAQKRAAQFFRDTEQFDALQARNKRKGRSKTDKRFASASTLVGRLRSEERRASGLGSLPFADPMFNFGGRSAEEQIARGGTFGRRVGGQSINDQLSFISGARQKTASARIGFAKSLLSGSLFGASFEKSSVKDLLSVVGSQEDGSQIQFAPQTFEQVLSEGRGFFDTEAIPVTKPTRAGRERGRLVAARKIQDAGKAETARLQIQTGRSRQALFQEERGTTPDDLSRLSADLLRSNTARGRSIEARNALAPPRFSGEFTLGNLGVRSGGQGNVFGAGLAQASQAQKARKSASKNLSVSGRVKSAKAKFRKSRTKQTDAQLRAKIASGISVPLSDFNRLTKSSPTRKTRKRSRSGSKTTSTGTKTASSRTPSQPTAQRSSGGFDFGASVRSGVSAAKFLGTLATGGNPFPAPKGTRKTPLPSARSALNSLGGFQI